ncbi:hypothetical protein ES288_D06G180800v1 [Gossypium darwinii]|uniref:Uncharacterized protein n=2 Tax=Gossypium TaxID=3633 RepID=A0A5D2KML8_GOSTO|nr:hypothetical protein ES288_D06G180800v1 [Gossypium darwinii]TYH67343.1 hypothetical protein ES332_D06G182700v1 [Gossypium tomentosum]
MKNLKTLRSKTFPLCLLSSRKHHRDRLFEKTGYQQHFACNTFPISSSSNLSSSDFWSLLFVHSRLNHDSSSFPPLRNYPLSLVIMGSIFGGVSSTQ